MVDPRSQTNKKSKTRPLKKAPESTTAGVDLEIFLQSNFAQGLASSFTISVLQNFPFLPQLSIYFSTIYRGLLGGNLKNHPYVAIRKSSTSMTLGSQCEFFGVCIMLLAISVASKKSKSHMSNGTKSSGRLTFYTDGFYRDPYDGLWKSLYNWPGSIVSYTNSK